MAAPLQPDGTGRVVDYVVAAGLNEAAFHAAIDDGAGSGAYAGVAEVSEKACGLMLPRAGPACQRPTRQPRQTRHPPAPAELPLQTALAVPFRRSRRREVPENDRAGASGWAIRP